MANIDIKAKDVISKLAGLSDNPLWRNPCNALAGFCDDSWRISIWVPDLPAAGAPAAPAAPAAPSAPPVDAVAVLGQLAQAINQASSVLDKEHLMVASGSLTVDVNVKIPGTDIGAESHLSLQIGPKPYN
jgi:hypothetical protein